jgi:Tfp pilus assembly protein PilE
MNKKVILLIVIITILSLILFSSYQNYKQNFNESIYVITLDKENKENYYEIGLKEHKRKTTKFISDNMTVYELKNCYDSYNVKVSNKLTMDSCKIYNDNEIIKMPEEFYDIIEKTSKIEHAILTNKIMVVDNNYFVQVSLNVNLWTPYELYRYNPKTKKLNLIYTFNNEDVIGIKIK